MDALETVTELDCWLDNSNDHTTAIDRRTVLRARDEIVALRERVKYWEQWEKAGSERDAALEEAARVCDEPAKRLRKELGWSAEAELLERYAAAIRALKGKSDE